MKKTAAFLGYEAFISQYRRTNMLLNRNKKWFDLTCSVEPHKGSLFFCIQSNDTATNIESILNTLQFLFLHFCCQHG